jgi:hypothetical protein
MEACAVAACTGGAQGSQLNNHTTLPPQARLHNGQARAAALTGCQQQQRRKGHEHHAVHHRVTRGWKPGAV